MIDTSLLTFSKYNLGTIFSCVKKFSVNNITLELKLILTKKLSI